jgi:hypothetical protein
MAEMAVQHGTYTIQPNPFMPLGGTHIKIPQDIDDKRSRLLMNLMVQLFPDKYKDIITFPLGHGQYATMRVVSPDETVVNDPSHAVQALRNLAEQQAMMDLLQPHPQQDMLPTNTNTIPSDGNQMVFSLTAHNIDPSPTTSMDLPQPQNLFPSTSAAADSIQNHQSPFPHATIDDTIDMDVMQSTDLELTPRTKEILFKELIDGIDARQ